MSSWGNAFKTRWADNYINHYFKKKSPIQLKMEQEVAKLGVPYQAQFPHFGVRVIADFAIPSMALLIELDGKEHRAPKKRKEDAERDAKMRECGWYTVRIRNEEADADPAAALRSALDQLAAMKKEDEIDV